MDAGVWKITPVFDFSHPNRLLYTPERATRRRHFNQSNEPSHVNYRQNVRASVTIAEKLNDTSNACKSNILFLNSSTEWPIYMINNSQVKAFKNLSLLEIPNIYCEARPPVIIYLGATRCSINEAYFLITPRYIQLAISYAS